MKRNTIPELIFSADKEMGWMLRIGEKTIGNRFESELQFDQILQWFKDAFGPEIPKTKKIDW